jgi:hypothetical protein
MIYDNPTYEIANDKAIILNDKLSVQQTALLVYIPIVEAISKKPFYRANVCCVPVADTNLLTWPTLPSEMPMFSYKCAAAKIANSRWIVWGMSNLNKTLAESTAQYSIFLLEELNPYI